jgi:hypothetical protein
MGCAGYFSDSWCQFDFLLVCTTLLDQFASELLTAYLPVPPMLLRALRVLRVLRILRLLKGAKQLRDLIVTMVLSFPSLLNVGSLLALIVFMFAVLGVNMFTFVAHGDPLRGFHGGINAQRNFDGLGNALLVLLQCLTSDGWSSVMADAMQDEAGGACSDAAGDCGTLLAVPYFIAFQIVGSFLFLNLVVAVIIQNFESLYFVAPNLASASDLEIFAEAWADFDPDATNLLPMATLPELLLRVPRPLGVRGRTKAQAKQLCLHLRVQQHKGLVAYNEVLKALIGNNYYQQGADVDVDDEDLPAGVPVPKLNLATLPERPLLQRGDAAATAEAGGDESSSDEEPLPDAAANQQSIAEVFAMATMFRPEVRSAFARSLQRARQRIRAAKRARKVEARMREEAMAEPLSALEQWSILHHGNLKAPPSTPQPIIQTPAKQLATSPLPNELATAALMPSQQLPPPASYHAEQLDGPISALEEWSLLHCSPSSTSPSSKKSLRALPGSKRSSTPLQIKALPATPASTPPSQLRKQLVFSPTSAAMSQVPATPSTELSLAQPVDDSPPESALEVWSVLHASSPSAGRLAAARKQKNKLVSSPSAPASRSPAGRGATAV